MVLPAVLPIRPYFREMVWGGRRLAEKFGKELPEGKQIGESFELSAYEGRESRIGGGSLAGMDLRRLCQEHGAELMGEEVWRRNEGLFPLLIKLLDAQDDLSIQVHPDDAYAQAKGLGPRGKMEAWFVLHSDGGQVAYGLKEGVGAQDLRAAIDAGTVEEAVQFHRVERGDIVFSPPGTVHALCRGVIIYEVQQSSDLTFRLYDYGRPGMDGKPRQLHIDEALDVIDFGARLGGPLPLAGLVKGGGPAMLVESEYFTLEYGRVSGAATHAAGDSFAAVTLVGGGGRVSGDGVAFDGRGGDTYLVPAGRSFRVDGEDCEYLVARAVC